MTNVDMVPIGKVGTRKALRELRNKIENEWDVELLPFRSNKNTPVHIRNDVWIWVPTSFERLVAGVRGYDGDILNMTISSNNRGAAGRLLLSAKNGRLLCHKGHLGGNKTPVCMEDFLAEVEGHKVIHSNMEELAVVANLDDHNVLSRISHFVRECARIRMVADLEPSMTPEVKVGFNPGARDTQERRSSIAMGRHFTAATELKKAVGSLGWKVVRRAMIVRPDLLVGKSKKIALFEVKPDGDLSSFVTAIGELITYSADLHPDLKIVAARPPSERSKNLVMQVLKDHGIRFCAIERDGSISIESVKAALK